ncbi:hypothetical protein ACB092_04G001300 [Castanea dentata]
MTDETHKRIPQVLLNGLANRRAFIHFETLYDAIVIKLISFIWKLPPQVSSQIHIINLHIKFHQSTFETTLLSYKTVYDRKRKQCNFCDWRTFNTHFSRLATSTLLKEVGT